MFGIEHANYCSIPIQQTIATVYSDAFLRGNRFGSRFSIRNFNIGRVRSIWQWRISRVTLFKSTDRNAEIIRTPSG
jgi:hypothetical protein